MTDLILQHLEALERSNGITILYAVESGSRAWGFESADSDYDVRFLYSQPIGRYLSIRPPKEVVEQLGPEPLDFAGWDLRKTLHLMAKSNPSLLEWLASPIIYRSHAAFMEEFRRLAAAWTQPERLMHHYRSMAWTNYTKHLTGGQVSLKKYLYVLRPICACRWIEQRHGPVAIEFDVLRKAVLLPDAVNEAIEELLELKRGAMEMATIEPHAVLHPFVEEELARIQPLATEPPSARSDEELDTFFRRWIGLGETA